MVRRLVSKKTRFRSRTQTTRMLGIVKIPKRELCAISIFCIIVSSMAFIGSVSGQLQANVTVNSGNAVGTNKLSLGFVLASDWRTWRDRPAMEQLAKDANFKLVRVYSTLIEPCTGWNEASMTGTFNWAEIDLLMQRIFEVGAEPLICLGFATASGLSNLPSGMKIAPATGLPYPNSFAAYCREWVKHFKQKGRPVRFYEIVNEPWIYFGWNDYAKMANFKGLFNAASQAMKLENPSIMISFDGTNRKPVLNYWLANGGAELGFISFHKYDSNVVGRFSDYQMFLRAETFQVMTDPGGPDNGYYGIRDSRQKYYSARGKQIPVILSETNFNSAWVTGSDPKIQQMAGAVWTALLLRIEVLEGLDYNTYFTFSSSKSWEIAHKSSGGFGLGMVNLDDNQPWNPYYVQKLIGRNMAVGDQIVETTSSSPDVESLAWIHGGKVNALVVCKNDSARSLGLRVYGLQGILDYSKIDNAVSWQYPRIQTGTIDSAATLTINGYTVILLQGEASSSAPTVFSDGFESGKFTAWDGTSTSPDEAASISSTLRRQGTYSATFATNGNTAFEGAYCYKTLSPQSELYATGYFYVTQSGIGTEDNRFYLIRFKANGNNVAYAGWRMVGGMTKWSLIIRDGTGYVVASSSSNPTLNQWYSVQLHWVQDSTKGYGELYVDGVLVCSISGRNTANFGSVNMVRFGLAEVFNCRPTTVYCDDCKIAKTR